MKTTFEIETFIKTQKAEMRVSQKAGKFVVEVYSNAGIREGEGQSSTLSQAIENVMIDLRQKGEAEESQDNFDFFIRRSTP